MFRAPWGKQVRIATTFVVGLLVFVGALPWILSAGAAGAPGVVASVAAFGILVATALSGVRGYAIRPDGINVRRVGWTTHLPRSGIRGVEVAPGVTRGSLRLFGNGGVFGFTGYFRNRRLGTYRAFVTDPDRAVVLHYYDRRVVISPDRPSDFARTLGVPMLPPGSSAGAGTESIRRYGWLLLIPIVVSTAIAVMIYVQSRPLDVQLDAGRLRIHGGFYEVDLPFTRIRSVERRESRPPIGRRTNGFALGSTLRGYFEVEGLGRSRVFVDGREGPYLILTTDDGPIIVSLRERAQTDALAASLAAQAPLRKPDIGYVPTPQPVVEAMLDVARVTKDDVVYDLGSGDGRIPITAVQRYGARAVGIDIDPERIAEARANAAKAGVTDRERFLQQDLFTSDISEATVVTVYLYPELNEKLLPKLNRELRPGTRVVSHAFEMADIQPKTSLDVGGRPIYLFVVPIE